MSFQRWWTNKEGMLKSRSEQMGKTGENGVWKESLNLAYIEKLRVISPNVGAIAYLNMHRWRYQLLRRPPVNYTTLIKLYTYWSTK
jgi:hypothetical protein